MKSILLSAIVFACSSSAAMAGVNAGGVLTVVLSEGTVFSTDVSDYCGSNTLGGDCSNGIVRQDGAEGVVLNVLAAFNPAGSPRLAGLTFGVDYNDSELFLVFYGPCADFELSTGSWPAPGEGTAVTWAVAEEGSLTEAYWFAAYEYYGNPNLFSLIPHPTQGARFADDSVPSELDEIVCLGSFGFNSDGRLCCPSVEGGACCLAPGDCVDNMSQQGCESQGGEFGGSSSFCDDPGFCPPALEGACCLEDGSCVQVDQESCATLGGEFVGEGVDCEDVECEVSPTFESSWGQIKAWYR